MDPSFLANMLFFLGAPGGNYAIDQATARKETDPLYDENDYARSDEGSSRADAEIADLDSLAWFLYGGDDALTGSAGADIACMGAGADISLGAMTGIGCSAARRMTACRATRDMTR